MENRDALLKIHPSGYEKGEAFELSCDFSNIRDTQDSVTECDVIIHVAREKLRTNNSRQLF